jgi:uracil-DNA glycosylase
MGTDAAAGQAAIDAVREAVAADPENAAFTAQGWHPLFAAAPDARIVIVGQAPGARAQASGILFDDASGVNLIEWLGVDEATFRDPGRIAILPMDFYYPGRGATGGGRSGDLPPRRGFADRWHPALLAQLPDVRLTLLIGTTAQQHYLGSRRKANLTETVRAFREYLPDQLPLVHPSPLNFRWQGRNPWFREEVLPALRTEVARALA